MMLHIPIFPGAAPVFPWKQNKPNASGNRREFFSPKNRVQGIPGLFYGILIIFYYVYVISPDVIEGGILASHNALKSFQNPIFIFFFPNPSEQLLPRIPALPSWIKGAPVCVVIKVLHY